MVSTRKSCELVQGSKLPKDSGPFSEVSVQVSIASRTYKEILWGLS